MITAIGQSPSELARPASAPMPSTPVLTREDGHGTDCRDISVVVPVFNEEECLPLLAEELLGVLKAYSHPWEVILVDDGSTDRSPRLIDDLCAAQGWFRALHLKVHVGQSAALFAGFQAARHAITVALDADLQNDPRDILRLLEHMSLSDCVCGWRQSRQDNVWRRVQSKIGNAVRNWVLGESIADAACTLKAYRTDMLQRINLFQGGHRFLATLMALEGARVLEVPVRHRPRAAGVSKVPCGRRAARATIDLLGVWWMRSRALRSTAARSSLPTQRGS